MSVLRHTEMLLLGTESEMNGNVALELKAPLNMACKPIITYAGDAVLFRTLETLLVEGLPKETVEWKRSYGRAVKSVSTKATFIPFSKDILPKGGSWQLTHQPIFHIFWTECVDVEVYKSSVRDEIEAWLRALSQHGVPDWLVVIVETYDLRKGNKLLPRTTVLDKVRSDFASKHADRCLSVINPVRSESRSAESWRGLLTRVCVLTLAAYNRTLLKFEEFIRDQRERRNEPGWNFCHYFLLQEELAFVLEMLGVYDEALVQYDELDALFTQFVLNYNVGEVPGWLGSFQSPLDSWPGLVLDRAVDQTQRLLLGESRASLLQFRAYLFSRQCSLLQMLNRPHEMAQRCLPFLHNCVKELGILEIAAPPGALACWVFLCCLEVLQGCSAAREAELEACARHTAPLWAYAREKLEELGQLCGLLPGLSPSSQQLHTVVLLSAGMGDPRGDGPRPSPTDVLKEALSSAAAFNKHYLETAELAMGTYKHVGRLRSARAVGRELARFHLLLGHGHKAAALLQDSLQAFQDEGWARLVPPARLALARSCRGPGDAPRLVKTCAAIASSQLLDDATRVSYFDQMLQALDQMPPEAGGVVAALSDAFALAGVEVCEARPITEGSEVAVRVCLDSRLPRPLPCPRVALSVEELPAPVAGGSGVPSARPHDPRRPSPAPAPAPAPACAHRLSTADARPANPAQLCLHMVEHLDHKEDGSLSCVSIVSRNPKQFLRRRDSQGRSRKTSATARGDFSYCLSAQDVTLAPGANSFLLTCQARDKGWYRLGQLSLQAAAGRLEFLSPALSPRVGFEVRREPASVSLNKGEGDLLAGVEQLMVLSVSTGTHVLQQGSELRLRASRGLAMQLRGRGEPLAREVSVPLPAAGPFGSLSVELAVLAELPPRRDSSPVDHKVCIQCPWQAEERVAPLHFQPPFTSSLRLHTARATKFLQVQVCGLSARRLELEGAGLAVSSEPHLPLRCLAPPSHHPLVLCLRGGIGLTQVVGDGMNASFMWEIDVAGTPDTTPIKTDFSVRYRPVPAGEHPFMVYRCNFDVTDYKTLFAVKCRVEPTKGSDFLRSGTMCSLLLDVQRLCPGGHSSLMYEVLTDQNVWAVCGRTAGVISLETADRQHVALDVMPMTGGYLPLPGVRLSKYIPAELKTPGKDTSASHPRLEPFSAGQVYNSSKAQQVHVLPPAEAAPS